MVRKRKIPNLERLEEEALVVAHNTTNLLEARHHLIWWLSSYERKMARGFQNETIALSEFQANEFKYSYLVSETVQKFYLLIQPENWFFNDIEFESASVDENGIVLSLGELNSSLFKFYIARMQIRISMNALHKNRLLHAKKFAKELVFIKYDPDQNVVSHVGQTIALNNSLVTKTSSQSPNRRKAL